MNLSSKASEPISHEPLVQSQKKDNPLEIAPPFAGFAGFEAAPTQIKPPPADDAPFLDTPSIDVEITNNYPKNKPTTSRMVADAIRKRSAEGRRRGASLQSIKKYIESSFMVDVSKRNHLIKQCLVNGVARGQFVQLSGQGASGSFRMPNTRKKVLAKSKSGVSKRTVKTSNKKRKPSSRRKLVKSEVKTRMGHE